jgi:hypothetical protein
MRLGCGGCLLAIALLACLAGAIGGIGWATARLLEDPGVTVDSPTAADSSSAQHKLYELMSRTRHAAREPTVLTEREINALLSRQLADEVPLTSLIARLLGGDQVEIAGLLPLRQLLIDVPGSRVLELLPERWATRPVWLHLHTRARMEVTGSRRHLRLEVERFEVGRLRLPRIATRLLLEPESLRWLRLALPDDIQSITIEPGRAVIRVAS